jgi:plastocyanin
MSSSVNRPARLTLAGLVVALTLALAPAGASAAVTVVKMPTRDFNPKEVSVDRGAQVRWRNNGFESHDVRSTLTNYFRSPGGVGGLSPGETYTFTFRSAGNFAYVCKAHQEDGMLGEVVVPISVTKLTDPVRFRIFVASQAASAPFTHVIEVDKPGAGGFTPLKTTTASSFTFKPANHGTFLFRAKVRNTAAGTSSGYSPVVSRSW